MDVLDPVDGVRSLPRPCAQVRILPGARLRWSGRRGCDPRRSDPSVRDIDARREPRITARRASSGTRPAVAASRRPCSTPGRALRTSTLGSALPGWPAYRSQRRGMQRRQPAREGSRRACPRRSCVRSRAPRSGRTPCSPMSRGRRPSPGHQRERAHRRFPLGGDRARPHRQGLHRPRPEAARARSGALGPPRSVTRYLTLAEYFWLAEQVTGTEAAVARQGCRVELDPRPQRAEGPLEGGVRR